MTRTMLDALNPDDIPIDTPTNVLIAAYLGHSDNPASYDQAAARFPNHHIVSIAAHNAVDAQILDVESGAVEPTDFGTMRAWCARQLDRDVFPTIYCNTSTWPSIPRDIQTSCNWWAARWSPDQTFPAGACGLQYAGQPGYDISVLSDYIEGIDPMTTPLTEAEVEAAVEQGTTAAVLGSLQTMYGATSPAAENMQTIGASLKRIVELLEASAGAGGLPTGPTPQWPHLTGTIDLEAVTAPPVAP